MVVVIVVVVVALVLVAAGVLVAVRSSGRTKERPGVAGEPATRPKPDVLAPEPTAPAPSVEELEALLRGPEVEAPPAPAPEVEVEVTPAPVAEPEPAAVEEVLEKPRLRDRLGRTRAAFSGVFSALGGHKIDEGTWDDIEEAMLLADVGLPTTQRILDAVRARAKAEGVVEADGLVTLVRDEVVSILDDGAGRDLNVVDGEPNVWMFVGVNGVGKTTTIGKLASLEVREGHKVLLAAADTFRAAAADQLQLWAERTGGECVRGQDGADPGSVVFNAMDAAAGRKVDLVLVDTAGRLHTNSNLMEELQKLRRIVDRTPGALKEVLLVIDATTGQNGLVQAKQFADAVDVTGIVLTKLDGTAKGGIVLAIQSELGLPVKVVGVGETAADLVPFDPSEFAAALFDS
jgi:fused signal recognition particle receptor